MHNLVLLILAITGMGVFFTFAAFVLYYKTKKQPSPKVIMAAVGMFTVGIILLFIV